MASGWAGRKTAALEVVHVYVDIKDSGSVPLVVEVLLCFHGIH